MNKPIISAILIFGAIVLMVIVFLPKYKEFQLDRAQILSLKSGINVARAYHTQLKELSNKLETYQENLSKIDTALPSQPSFPSLFSYLAKVAFENELVLNEVSLVKTQALKSSKIQGHSFSVSLIGSYLSLKNFLSKIERSLRFIEITSISFSSPVKEGIFNFQLGIKVYSY